MNKENRINTNCMEMMSINALEDSLAYTNGILFPYINNNDKEPSWDGHVYIYKNTDSAKKDIKGKVYVQVKGTSIDYNDPKTYTKGCQKIKKSYDCNV